MPLRRAGSRLCLTDARNRNRLSHRFRAPQTAVMAPLANGAKAARSEIRRRLYIAEFSKIRCHSVVCGYRIRIGYHGEHRHGLLNSRHPNPCKKERPPMVRRYAALAYAPGAPLPDPLPAPRLEIAFDEQTQVLARFSLEAQAPLIVF